MEHADHTVFLIKLLVFLLNGKIGERQEQVLKIHHIVPNYNLITDTVPPFHQVPKLSRALCGSLQIRRTLVARHGAELDDNIILGLDAVLGGSIVWK